MAAVTAISSMKAELTVTHQGLRLLEELAVARPGSADALEEHEKSERKLQQQQQERQRALSRLSCIQ